MKVFKSLDPIGTEPAMQKPLEEYPGFLGYEMGPSELMLSKELEALNEVNWQKYFEVADEVAQPIEIVLNLDNVEIRFKASEMNWKLGNILEIIPSIEVQQDPDYGYDIFFLNEGYTCLQAETHIRSLVDAVKSKNKELNIHP